jgi:hypothetical protein
MTITRERFEQGMTYTAYKDQMTRNREQLEANERSLALSADQVAFFSALPQVLDVLVLTEDWCSDALANLPILARLATASGKLNLRIFLRDQNLDLSDQFLKDGMHRSIPVFAFFDDDFRELGRWIERPAVISAQQGAAMAELFASAPELMAVAPGTPPALLPEAARTRLIQFFDEFRTRTRATSDAEVVREIRALLSTGLTAK